METQKYDKTADSHSIPNAPKSKIIVGAKQLRKALINGRTKTVYLARNADPAITEPIEAMCLKFHVDYVWVPNMLDLGKACGIEVGAAAAAAVD